MKTNPTNFEITSGLHIIARQKAGTTDAKESPNTYFMGGVG